MVSLTTERVPVRGMEGVNERIREMMERNVLCSAAGGNEAITRRIAELDQEWDMDRALEANVGAVSIAAVMLGITVSRKWFALPAIAGGFLLQYAIEGWCPPVSILRRLGFRTQTEIARERYALKALRGDFHEVPAREGPSPAAAEAINAASR